MLAPENCALFIGVEDYSLFDESLGQPAGTSHLPGGRADVLAFFRICRDMGIPVENLRICTSPKLDPSQVGDLPPECLYDATSAAIREGLAWLAGRLGAESRPAGLLSYSGHGDWLEGRGLVLCPSDTTGPNLTNAVPFDEIEALFQEQQAAANLTVVLDTCHAGAATERAGRRAGSLTGRSLPAALTDVIPALGDRVLAACGPAELAWRGRFSGLYRGAFSWAVGSTLEQWTPRMDGRNVELDLSYEELLDRTRRLLSSLDFSQSPQLLGKLGTGQLPFLHGAKKPDIILQVDPDYKVGITLSWYTSLPWTVVSVGGYSPAGSGYNLSTEYWALDSTFLSQLGRAVPGGTLTMTPQSYTSPWPAAPLTNPTISIWSPSSAPSGARFWYSNVTTNTYIGLSFNLTAGTPWTGTITWYVAAPTGTTPPDSIVGATTTAFTYTSTTPSLPSGYSWFTMRLPALVWASAPTVADSSSAVLGTALATAGIVVCLAYIQSASGTVRSRTSTNGTTWGSSVGAIATGAQGSPGVAALGSTFHLAYNVSGTLQHRTSTDGMNWTGTGTITTSSGSPSLATVVSASSTLCAAYQSGGNSSHIHTRAWNGASWSTPSTATSSATGAGSIAALGSSLYLAVPTSSGFSIFRATSVSTSGIAWPGSATATITPPSGSTWTGPGLSAWQGQLVLTFKDQAGQVWACFSPDGVSWSGYQNLTSQIPAVATNAPMSAGALGTRLILAFNKTTATTGLASIATT
jgi:hypothetical protein